MSWLTENRVGISNSTVKEHKDRDHQKKRVAVLGRAFGLRTGQGVRDIN